MKRFSADPLLAAVFSVTLAISVYSEAGQTLQLVQVNTDDIPNYLAWAEEAAPVMLEDAAGAIGVCVPRFGAEEQGDVYFYSIAPNMEAFLSLDLNAPNITNETARIAERRTVVARDIATIQKSAPTRRAGTSWSQMSLFVETTQVGRYVQLLGEQETALHENGFEDAHWTVFAINTGEFTGQIVANLTAPTGARLGAALDAVQSAPWSNFVQGSYDGVRTLVNARLSECEVFAAN